MILGTSTVTLFEEGDQPGQVIADITISHPRLDYRWVTNRHFDEVSICDGGSIYFRVIDITPNPGAEPLSVACVGNFNETELTCSEFWVEMNEGQPVNYGTLVLDRTR